MMMLTAPDVAATAAFYVDHLGFRVAARTAEEVIVEGHGMQIVLSVGPGGRHVDAPSPDQAAVEIPSTMPRIEALWDLDRTRDHSALGPMLE
jgi:catechol 2,3-dioxygenase-like lactoylglutathione lyase family enzyme